MPHTEAAILGSPSNLTTAVILIHRSLTLATPCPPPLSLAPMIEMQGYSAFDLDGDGLLSLSDLKNAAATLDLDLRVSLSVLHLPSS